MTRFATALVHHPCVNRNGEIFTTSITNLDVHDIARSSRTYGIDAFYVVTPIKAQRDMANRIVGYWAEDGKARNPDRNVALEVVRVVASIDDAIAEERSILGRDPLLVITSAKARDATPCATFRPRLAHESALLLFGTGYGLAPAVVQRADVVLEPLLGASADAYNHLSVRSAAAIFLDRLRG